MSRPLTLVTWLLVLTLALSGLGGAYLHYVVESTDPFNAWNHPWQPQLERVHALAGPALALLLGYVLAAHAKPHLQLGSPRRRPGLRLSGLSLALVASGGAQAAFGGPEARLLVWVHGVLGSLFLLLFLGHAFGPLWQRLVSARRRAAGDRR